MSEILQPLLHLTVTMPCERGLLPSCTDEKTSVYRIKEILRESGRSRICILVGLTPGHTFPPPCGTWLSASCHPRLLGSWASAHSVPSGRSVLPPPLHLRADPSSNGSSLSLRNQTSYPFLRTPTAFHLHLAHISILRESYLYRIFITSSSVKGGALPHISLNMVLITTLNSINIC